MDQKKEASRLLRGQLLLKIYGKKILKIRKTQTTLMEKNEQEESTKATLQRRKPQQPINM